MSRTVPFQLGICLKTRSPDAKGGEATPKGKSNWLYPGSEFPFAIGLIKSGQSLLTRS